MSDTWYKRDPRYVIDQFQGMGPELIGAYAVILEILFARGGEMDRDDRHLSGVLGCSLRKARALTVQLLELEKISIVGGKIRIDWACEQIEERRKQRENSPKSPRNKAENRPTSNENKGLTSQSRIEENIYPLTPKGDGDFSNSPKRASRRQVGVSDGVKSLLRAQGYLS